MHTPSDPLLPPPLKGDVRPILAEMLHAAAILPPPPSPSDLEVAEEPGPSTDRPTDVTTVVEQALESGAVEQQQQQAQQRNRPVSPPGGDPRTRQQERYVRLDKLVLPSWYCITLYPAAASLALQVAKINLRMPVM